ncbi:MAG: hypothetical protein SCM11_17945 [Bacillota bacterium]|nr:hypothetical protein [Bacillota bacterium]
MFPIEVGTWRGSIAPWRATYGQALRSVGGMDWEMVQHYCDRIRHVFG